MKCRPQLLLLTLLLSLSGMASAQMDTAAMDSDELFQIARTNAFTGQREYARKLCRMILEKSPEYADVRILLARTLAWDGRRNDARKELDTVLRQSPSNIDAVLTLADVEYWDDQHVRTVDLVNRMMSRFPNDLNLLFRKARALHALQRDKEALRILNVIGDIDPSMQEAASLRQSIELPSLRFQAGADYTHENYSKVYDPMKYGTLQLGYRTSIGSVILKLNYADRFGSRGFQTEMDAYPKIADGLYAYLNYGYSAYSLFPRHRGGAELYSRLPSAFEGSVGFRHLYFGPGSSVTIYTGSIGWYYGSYWFSLRPYLTPNNAGVSRSVSIAVRRYFADAEHYLGLKAAIGYSPDGRTIQSSSGLPGTAVYLLSSQSATVQWQYPASATLLLLVSADYTHQELSFDPGNYVDVITLSAGVRIKF